MAERRIFRPEEKLRIVLEVMSEKSRYQSCAENMA